jgi:hypothetical protein
VRPKHTKLHLFTDHAGVTTLVAFVQPLLRNWTGKWYKKITPSWHCRYTQFYLHLRAASPGAVSRHYLPAISTARLVVPDTYTKTEEVAHNMSCIPWLTPFSYPLSPCARTSIRLPSLYLTQRALKRQALLYGVKGGLSHWPLLVALSGSTCADRLAA